MTTVQADFHNILSAEMSYQEIDFVEHVGDNDIDIDIDLETGQNDEDYILDDVRSDAGNEETVVGNDDVMVDDENVSYPMDDVDIVQEEHVDNLHMEDVSEMPVSDSINPGIENPDVEKVALLTSSLDDPSEAVMDEPDSRKDPLRDLETEHVAEDRTLNERTEISSKRREQGDSGLSPPTSPIEHDHSTQEGTDPPASSFRPDHITSVNADTDKESPTDTVFTSDVAAIAGQTPNEIGFKAGRGDDIILTAENVIVVYREAEYSLISTSDSDDPDSFFLKDSELIKGSLAALLAGLREVIYDDLGPEDELCLSVDDLGIEISEVRLFHPI
jgi:hypothetical protein